MFDWKAENHINVKRDVREGDTDGLVWPKKVLSSLKRIAGKKKKTSKKINKKNTLNHHQSAFSVLLSLAHTLSLVKS